MVKMKCAKKVADSAKCHMMGNVLLVVTGACSVTLMTALRIKIFIIPTAYGDHKNLSIISMLHYLVDIL